MKIIHALAAAGILMTSAVAAAPAEAQRYRDYRNYDRHEYRDRDRDRRRWDRKRYAQRRHAWNRGHHYGWRKQQRCWTEYRWSRPVRVCRR